MGVEAFVAVKAGEQENQLAKALSAAVSQTLSSPNRGVKPENQSQHKTLGILRPVEVNVLLEIAFIMNKEEIATYLQMKQQVATQIAHTLFPLFSPVAVN